MIHASPSPPPLGKPKSPPLFWIIAKLDSQKDGSNETPHSQFHVANPILADVSEDVGNAAAMNISSSRNSKFKTKGPLKARFMIFIQVNFYEYYVSIYIILIKSVRKIVVIGRHF